MRAALVALAILSITPIACAQPYYAGPGEGPPHGEYWRERRVEYAREQRHEEWLRDHCGRTWDGELVCRR